MPLNIASTTGTGVLYSIAPSAAASSLGNWSAISTAFAGADISKVGWPLSYTITGAASLSEPTTGYVYNPELSPVAVYLKNTSGWNNDTAGNNGRTAATIIHAKVDNYGQGDCIAFAGRGFVTGSKVGATSYLANPAVSVLTADVQAGAAGTYLNPVEIDLDDQGFDVAGEGVVVNMKRSNNAGALGVVWHGYHCHSTGTQPIDKFVHLSGPAVVGIDLAGATISGAPIIAPLQTPANSAAAGTVGSICWDANYIYICTATNSWKRVALTAF